LHNWFDQMVVTRKREDISNLIKDLIKRSNSNNNIDLPDIELPTKDGKLVEDESFEEAFGDDLEEEEMDTTEAPNLDKSKPSVSQGQTPEKSSKSESAEKTPVNSQSNEPATPSATVTSPPKASESPTDKSPLAKKRAIEKEKNGNSDESSNASKIQKSE
jgi:hypothetical protein